MSFYQYDGHGSVRQLTNQQGQITDTYTYDAFGNLINRTGSTPNDYLYAGEQFDANLGFYYLRARYMNPQSGRFQTMDSFEGDSSDPISLHKYLYANADPVTLIDPSGQFSIAEISVANSIRSTLANIQGFTGQKLIENTQSAINNEEVSFVSVWDLLAVLPIAGIVISKMTKFSGNGGRGFVSGAYKVLKSKTNSKNPAILAEVRAAKALRDEGINVHFRTAAGDIGIQGERTSDLLVGGMRGTGINGIAYEVFSPETNNVARIASQLRQKTGQATRFILDLTRTDIQEDLSNLIQRINNVGGRPASNPVQEILFLHGDKIIGKIP